MRAGEVLTFDRVRTSLAGVTTTVGQVVPWPEVGAPVMVTRSSVEVPLLGTMVAVDLRGDDAVLLPLLVPAARLAFTER
jgi:hypothetical protein